MTNLSIDRERLWASLMEMARIGATPKGGSNRQALTDLDREGRDLFVRWCREAGLTVTVDRMGSIFARRPGRDPDAPPVLAGSHLDTQPTGGKFDGVFGVLAALEMVRTLNDHGVETDAPIEIVNWTNEEGARFSPPMVASGVFAGVFTLEEGQAKADAEGRTIGEELRRIGYEGEMECTGRAYAAYFEPHIEQGPILEREGKTIGIVTDAQGARWYEATVTGQEGHAGATPMEMRQDALVVAARLVGEIRRIGLDHAPLGRATVGILKVSPGSPNVVPGSVFFMVDLRHPDAGVLEEMHMALRETVERTAAELETPVDLKEIWYSPPVMFDHSCVDAVREAARAYDYSAREIVSGAGHDAVYAQRVVPTAMIFIPCEKGLSHNEAENVTPEDVAAGCNVLLHAVLSRAGAR